MRTTTLGQGLARVEAAVATRIPAPCAGPGPLTENERVKLAALAARCRPGEGPNPTTDHCGFSALRDGELGALV